jgi:hypothetical protein
MDSDVHRDRAVTASDGWTRRGVLGAAAAAVAAGGLALVGPALPAAGAGATGGAPRVQARWRQRAPMREARAEVGVAAIGGRVYVLGGTVVRGDQDPRYASTLLTSYEPRRDRWTRLAPLPRPLSHVGVAALHGTLYAFGGFTDVVHIDPQPLAFAYDPSRDRWSRLPDMPHELGSVSVAAVGGRLHLVGGRDSRRVVPVPGTPFSQGYGTVRTHLVYDPDRRRYATAEPLPGAGRDHAGIAVLRDRIHVVGGRTADVEDNLARHDVYDVRTRRWHAAAPLPRARSAGAAVVLDGRMVYAGGECTPATDSDPGSTYEDVTAYDPRTGRWNTLAPLPQARHAVGAAAVGGRAYVIGGAVSCGGGASTDTLELALVPVVPRTTGTAGAAAPRLEGAAAATARRGAGWGPRR